MAMGKRTILILAVLALLVAIAQKTPLAFLSPDTADFVWGLTVGLGIGALVAWFWGGGGKGA